MSPKLRRPGRRRYDPIVQCPYCTGDSSVTETRVTADGLRRRRICTACKRRFTTYEKLGAPGLKVHKRDGSLETFDGDKLYLDWDLAEPAANALDVALRGLRPLHPHAIPVHRAT